MNTQLLTGIAPAAYHADPHPAGPSLSATMAKAMSRGEPLAKLWGLHPRNVNRPAWAQALRDPERSTGLLRRPGDGLELGSLVDAMFFGGAEQCFAVCDRSTLRGRDKATVAEAAGQRVVTQAQWDLAARVVEQLRVQILAAGISEDRPWFWWDWDAGENDMRIVHDQPAILWCEEGELGAEVPCRALLDRLVLPPPGGSEGSVVWDLKALRSATDREVTSAVERYRYDIQGAAYVRAVEALRPDLRGRVQFRLLVVETEWPHLVRVAQFSPELLEHGDRAWCEAVVKWGRCLAGGRWPGYSDLTVELSPWRARERERADAAVIEEEI